jgi:hypothetical protein
MKQNSSIIEIIEKMVRDGEPEEKILKTLLELGVEPEKAKKLLLLGQADTFSLLKREIRNIVHDELEKEKPMLKKFIEEETIQANYEARQELTKAVISDLKEYEKDISGYNKTFQEKIEENVRKITEMNDKLKIKLNEMGENLRQVQIDMDEMRIKGIGSRNKLISNALWLLGLFFGVGTFYIFITSFGQALTIDNIIVMITMALITITMLFVATII